MGAAQKTPGKSNLPFGASPITLILAGILVVALAVTYLPGLLTGKSSPAPSAPVSRPAASTGSAPSSASTSAPVAGANSPAAIAVPSASDELSTFLLRFGRANPFAVTTAVSGRNPVGKAGRLSSDSTIGSLRRRAEELEKGGIPAGAGKDAGGAGASGQAGEGFSLTGIVRYGQMALAVITKSGKTYYVKAGEELGKTGYRLQAINEDNAVITSGAKELVLSLRRKKQ